MNNDFNNQVNNNSMDNQTNGYSNMTSNAMNSGNAYVGNNNNSYNVPQQQVGGDFNYSNDLNQYNNGGKKSNNGLLIIILLVVIVLLGGFVFLNKDKIFGSSGNDTSTNSSDTQKANNSNSQSEDSKASIASDDTNSKTSSGDNNKSSSDAGNDSSKNDSNIKNELQNLCNTKLDSDGNYISSDGNPACFGNVCTFIDESEKMYSLNCSSGEYEKNDWLDVKSEMMLSTMCSGTDSNGNYVYENDDDEYSVSKCENNVCYLEYKDGRQKSKVCKQ